MKLRTSDLQGVALDWAVAQSEGLQPHTMGDAWWIRVTDPRDGSIEHCQLPQYSTDWAQGGSLIEREKIALRYEPKCDWLFVPPQATWLANYEDVGEWDGPTPLIAAMRCFVASRLGDEVEVPTDLAA